MQKPISKLISEIQEITGNTKVFIHALAMELVTTGLEPNVVSALTTILNDLREHT